MDCIDDDGDIARGSTRRHSQPSMPKSFRELYYSGEDGQVRIAISQHECDRINIVRKNNYLGTITSQTHTLKLDGKDQKDSPWFGSSEKYTTSAKFVGSELQVTARTTGGSMLRMIYSLTPARDLIEEALTNPRGVPRVAKRQK